VLFREALTLRLHTEGGRGMYGGVTLTGETEVLGEKHYTAWVVDGWVCMEQWWNGTDRGMVLTGE
jgi:hypothetical protein